MEHMYLHPVYHPPGQPLTPKNVIPWTQSKMISFKDLFIYLLENLFGQNIFIVNPSDSF